MNLAFFAAGHWFRGCAALGAERSRGSESAAGGRAAPMQHCTPALRRQFPSVDPEVFEALLSSAGELNEEVCEGRRAEGWGADVEEDFDGVSRVRRLDAPGLRSDFCASWQLARRP